MLNIRIGSERQEELVLKNENLVYYVAKKYFVERNEPEDIESIGKIGLIKAAMTFDESKNITFATYACRCINNEILMYLKKEKKHDNIVSLHEPACYDLDGHELSWEDILPTSKKHFTDEMIENEEFINIINIILNCLKPKERTLMLYKIAGWKQNQIGEKLGVSQSYISRMDKKIIVKIRRCLSTSNQFKKVFLTEKIYGLYRIIFCLEDIQQSNKSSATLFQELKSLEDLLEFKVSLNNQRITIQLPADLQSFISIAHIMQKIDQFIMQDISKAKQGKRSCK